MTLRDVIEKLEKYNIKITIDNYSQVYAQMSNKLDDYCEIIKGLDEEIANKAILLKEGIKQCFKKYCNGNIYEATNTMNKLIEKYRNDLYIHDMNFGNSINIYEDVNKYMYKGAVGEWSKSFDRRYMLHIPFDKREVIKTQRFSMPGVPCLYLGQSIYIIWEELNRPSWDNLFVSRFELHKDTRVLDLGLSIFDLIQLDRAEYDEKIISYDLIKKFLVTNIFKIACLISVKQKERYFKSEYIIPQLVLMSVINLDIADGIRYSSVKVDNESYIYVNYAFPAIQHDETEMISNKIINKVKLTQPVNLGLYDFIKVQTMNRAENLFRNYTYFNVNNEYFTSYENTKFYDTELKINQNENLKLS